METKSEAKFKGVWEIKVKDLRDPATGKRFRDEMGRFLPRQVISESQCHNIITAEELNHILNSEFHNATQIHPWYCVMFEDDFTPDGDETYAVPGYTETEAYDEATRPEYEEAESVAQSLTNSANKAEFTASATKTFYGAALVGGGDDPTVKSNTAGGGTLACAGKFATAQPVIDGNVVQLTYTLTSADVG